ncbi:uncharacterized protein PHACADRAFT_109239, partial [Phanerochaete carnosa HHB-10118-sp]
KEMSEIHKLAVARWIAEMKQLLIQGVKKKDLPKKLVHFKKPTLKMPEDDNKDENRTEVSKDE